MQKKRQAAINPYKNISDLVDAISKPDETTIGFLADFYEQRKLVELVEAQAENVDLSYTCVKTGQPTGAMPFAVWSQLKEIHGEKRAKHVLETEQLKQVASHWLYTDDNALAELAKHDPYGYFVYAAAAILIPVQDNRGSQTRRSTVKIYDQDKKVVGQRTTETGQLVKIKDQNIKAFERVWRQEKAACWQNIQATSLMDILEANEIMRKYLSAFRTAKCYKLLPFKCSDIPPRVLGDTKSVREWIEEIQAAIEAILRHEIKRQKIRHKLSYADVVDLNLHYEGHGNFRRQKSKISGHERLLHELEDFIDPDLLERRPSLTFIMRDDKLDKPKPTSHTPDVKKLKAGGKFQLANFRKSGDNK